MSKSYWLTNVRLESGYHYEQDRVTGTQTDICNILIEEGKIADIVSASAPFATDLPSYDADKLLLLPSFEEMHIHLDKTYYGGPWKACTPSVNVLSL